MPLPASGRTETIDGPSTTRARPSSLNIRQARSPQISPEGSVSEVSSLAELEPSQHAKSAAIQRAAGRPSPSAASPSDSGPTLSNLLPEILLDIVGRLPARDLLALNQTCRSLHHRTLQRTLAVRHAVQVCHKELANPVYMSPSPDWWHSVSPVDVGAVLKIIDRFVGENPTLDGIRLLLCGMEKLKNTHGTLPSSALEDASAGIQTFGAHFSTTTSALVAHTDDYPSWSAHVGTGMTIGLSTPSHSIIARAHFDEVVDIGRRYATLTEGMPHEDFLAGRIKGRLAACDLAARLRGARLDKAFNRYRGQEERCAVDFVSDIEKIQHQFGDLYRVLFELGQVLLGKSLPPSATLVFLEAYMRLMPTREEIHTYWTQLLPPYPEAFVDQFFRVTPMVDDQLQSDMTEDMATSYIDATTRMDDEGRESDRLARVSAWLGQWALASPASPPGGI